MTWINDQRGLTTAPASSVLPLRFAEAELSKVPHPTCRAVADEYLKAFWEAASQGLAPALLGRTRTWKSYTAAAILRRVVDTAQIPSAFVECLSDVALLDRFHEKDQLTIRKWQRVGFLVLDDVLSLKADTYGMDVVKAVVSSRFSAMRPTLITGNIDAESGEVFAKISANYGALLARRIQDGSRGYTALLQ